MTVPEPPSANRYWRVYRNRVVKSAEARAYRQAVRMLAKHSPRVGPVAVTVTWYRGAKRGDLDNRLKVVLDAMEGVLYENDNQIVELHAYRIDDKGNARMDVEVEQA